METRSLALPDTRDAAVAYLAKRAAAGRCLRIEKSAGVGDSLGRIFHWLKDNPAVAYSLLGAGGGAAAGGLLNLGRDKEDRTPLSSMATGALAGGGLGLGAGLLAQSPALKRQLNKLPTWEGVKGKFSQGWEEFKDSFNPEADTASSGPETSPPSPTPEQQFIQYGVKNNLFTPEQYAEAGAEGQGQLLKMVETHAGENAMSQTQALGESAVGNLPLYGAGAAGVGAIETGLSMPRAGDLARGLDSSAAANLSPEMRAHLEGLSRSQAGRLARKTHPFNFSNKPVATVPGAPAGRGLVGMGQAATPSPASAAQQLQLPTLRNMIQQGRAARPGGPWLRRAGRGGQGLIGAGLLGKTFYDASQIHSEDIARQISGE
jgi:hypothetical protein